MKAVKGKNRSSRVAVVRRMAHDSDPSSDQAERHDADRRALLVLVLLIAACSEADDTRAVQATPSRERAARGSI
jgi:hypothetical protein